MNDTELARLTHVARLGVDAMRLLERCYQDADMPPDLSVDVGTLLLRVQNITIPRSTR